MEVSVDDKSEEDVPQGTERGQYAKQYTKHELEKAIEKIRNNELTYGAASQIYKVPKTTLHNKMRNPHNNPRGATTKLTKIQEDELAEWVLLHQQYGDPRTKQDIIIAAGEIAKLDEDSSKHFKNGVPTSGWAEGFLKRYPMISYRKPESISKASAINTKEDFAGLWRNIYGYMEKSNQLDLLQKPEIWWNCDETAFEKDKLPRKVLARKGSKKVHRRERGKPKDNTTITYAFSAAGDHAEPLITLKNSNSTIAEIAYALGSVGANYAINQTESGWAQTDSFYYYVTMHLYKTWETKNIPKPRILTVDGYKAHISVRLFRWARLHDVIIIILYPGGTPYLQMCDTSMFAPMKTKHSELYSQWRLEHPTKTMNDVEFVKILKKINDAVIKKQSIVNGWRATGLQPFNFNNLNCDGLLSKSPDRLYDFKGDHIDSTSNAMIIQSSINTLEFQMEPSDLPNWTYDNVVIINEEVINKTGNRLNMSDKDFAQLGDSSKNSEFVSGDLSHVSYSLGLVEKNSHLSTSHPETLGYQQHINLLGSIEENSHETLGHHQHIDLVGSVEENAHISTRRLENLGHKQRVNLVGLVEENAHISKRQPDNLGHQQHTSLVGLVEENLRISSRQPEMLGHHQHINLVGSVEENTHISTRQLESLVQQQHMNLDDYFSPYDVPDWQETIPQFDRVSIMDVENNDNSEQDEVMNNTINFSALCGRDRIFQSQVNASVNLTTFGVSAIIQDKQNGSKIAKLVAKIRRDVKDLGLLCAAIDQEKLVNVLIINQQLNFIDPPEVEQLNSDLNDNCTEPRTIKSILKPPTMPQRVKPKGKRNLKVSYGVVTTDEIIEDIEEREIAEVQQIIEREEDEISKNEREQKIKEVDEELRETRKMLTVLRSEASQQKKPKKHANDGVDLSLQERQQKIKEKDHQLRVFRDQLKLLKTDHVMANKAVAIKRRNYIEQKEERGNFVRPGKH